MTHDFRSNSFDRLSTITLTKQINQRANMIKLGKFPDVTEILKSRKLIL